MDEKRKKILIKVGVALILIALIGLVANAITRSVMEKSYSTSKEFRDDVVEDVKVVNGKDKDEVLAKINSGVYGEIDDIGKACEENTLSFLSIVGSPYLRYIADCTYDVYKIKAGYAIKISFSEGNELKVLCSDTTAIPVNFIKEKEFSEEEKEFFHSIGKCWEVPLPDGTYSIQYR